MTIGGLPGPAALPGWPEASRTRDSTSMLRRLSRLSVLAVLGAAACGGPEDSVTIDTRHETTGVSSTDMVAFLDGDRWAVTAQPSLGVYSFTPTGHTFAYV